MVQNAGNAGVLRIIHGSLSLYLFSTFTDTIRKPLKIGCADRICSHLKSVLAALSARDSACSEQLPLFNFTEEKYDLESDVLF